MGGAKLRHCQQKEELGGLRASLYLLLVRQCLHLFGERGERKKVK
jgi:hypothetical protein